MSGWKHQTKKARWRYNNMKEAFDYRSKRKMLIGSTNFSELIFPNYIFGHKNNIKKSWFWHELKLCIWLCRDTHIWIQSCTCPPNSLSPYFSADPSLSFHLHFRLASAHLAEKACFILLLYWPLNHHCHVNVRAKGSKIFKLPVNQNTGLAKYFV